MMQPIQATVVLTSLTEGISPKKRVFELTPKRNWIPVGRASKSLSKGLVGAHDNAWFDSPVMSRDHGKIELDQRGASVLVHDFGSMHGTLLNEKPLIPGSGYTVPVGAKVTFGAEVRRGVEIFPACSFRITYDITNCESVPLSPRHVASHIDRTPRRTKNTTSFSVPYISDDEEVSGESDEDSVQNSASDNMTPIESSPQNISSVYEVIDLTRDQSIPCQSLTPAVDGLPEQALDMEKTTITAITVNADCIPNQVPNEQDTLNTSLTDTGLSEADLEITPAIDDLYPGDDDVENVAPIAQPDWDPTHFSHMQPTCDTDYDSDDTSSSVEDEVAPTTDTCRKDFDISEDNMEISELKDTQAPSFTAGAISDAQEATAQDGAEVPRSTYHTSGPHPEVHTTWERNEIPSSSWTDRTVATELRSSSTSNSPCTPSNHPIEEDPWTLTEIDLSTSPVKEDVYDPSCHPGVSLPSIFQALKAVPNSTSATPSFFEGNERGSSPSDAAMPKSIFTSQLIKANTVASMLSNPESPNSLPVYRLSSETWHDLATERLGEKYGKSNFFMARECNKDRLAATEASEKKTLISRSLSCFNQTVPLNKSLTPQQVPPWASKVKRSGSRPIAPIKEILAKLSDKDITDSEKHEHEDSELQVSELDQLENNASPPMLFDNVLSTCGNQFIHNSRSSVTIDDIVEHPVSTKRKADAISCLADDEIRAWAVSSELASEKSDVLQTPAVDDGEFSQPSSNSSAVLDTTYVTVSESRPTKRLRRLITEAAIYATLGGVAASAGLFTILVATAPSFA